MFFWMRQRALNAPSSFFAGATVMFCGAFFPHVFAGHLPQLCAMAWAPLIFCAIDALFENIRFRYLLLGIFAVAMQLLAGFPQYVFYTAIIAGLYSLLRLLSDWNWRRAAALLGIYPGAALLAAVQLLPAIQTTRETTRGLRLPFAFASMVAFPPENFLTVLRPNFFGEMAKYWGRWYLWETSLFIGVVAFAFVVYAIICCERKTTLPAIIVMLVSLLLALGIYTPLFGFLYNWVPGFDRFRSISKFIFLAVAVSHFLGCHRTGSLVSRKKECRLHLIIAIFAFGADARSSRFVGNANRILVGAHEFHSCLRTVLFVSATLHNAEFIAQSQHRAATHRLYCCGIACAFWQRTWLSSIAKPKHFSA